MRCAKTRFHKICPTCGAVGMIPCPDCQDIGSKRLKGLEGVNGSEDPKGERSSTSSSKNKKKKGYTEDDYLSDFERVETHWKDLEVQYQEIQPSFEAGVKDEIHKLRGVLSGLNRSAQQVSDQKDPQNAHLLKAIQEKRAQVEALDRNWERLQKDFERLQQMEKRFRGNWERLPAWLPRLRPQDREDIQYRLEYLQGLLNVFQKGVVTLRDERPHVFPELVKEELATAAELQSLLEKAKKQAVESKNQTQSVETPKVNSQNRNQPDPSERAAPSILMESKSSGNDQAKGKAKETSTPEKTSAVMSSGEGFPDDGEEEEKESGGGGDGLVITLGLLGMALCGAIYFILHRRDEKITPIPPSRQRPPQRY